MKTLQNNFTTPEQSKRLLDLGVPADSADCYFHENRRKELDRIFHCGDKTYSEQLTTAFTYEIAPNMLPCWSVGRLIEIVDICSVKHDYAGKFEFEMNKSYIQNLIYLIIGMLHTKDLDFSKLEEWL